jgi:hypothetical protein
VSVSVSFELRSVSLAPARVNRVVDAWLAASGLDAKPLHLPDDVVEVFIAGISIRGFSARRRWAWFRNAIELRLNVCASHGDWQAAYSLLRFASQQGFQVRSEDGASMRTDDLSEAKASKESREQFANNVGFLWRFMASSGDNHVSLPTARFSVPVRQSDLPSEPFTDQALDSFEDVLRGRAEKYAAAQLASIVTLKTGATLIVWSGEALLAPQADHIVFASGEFDNVDYVKVPWAPALRELQDVVEKIQDKPAEYYFAPMKADDPRWRRLVKSGEPLALRP